MYKLQNRLKQPLIVNCKARVIRVLAGGSALVSEEEYQSPDVQALLSQGWLTAIPLQAAVEAAQGPGSTGQE